MAIENVTGTEYNDWLDGGDGENLYQGMAGDDWINGADGVNTIIYNLGDGIDTISYAPPRSYQFAGFLEEIERALAEDSFATGSYSNTYFSDASAALYDRLSPEIRTVLQGLGKTFVDGVGWVPGTVDGQAAMDAFSALETWINTPVSNVVELGAGITLADLTAQASASSSFAAPAIFSLTVGGGDQGVVFKMVPPDLSAAASTSDGIPPLDITFRFADGTTATLAQVLAQSDGGVADYNNGSENGEVMSGSLADDQIYGNGGDDQIDGRAGMDYLSGGEGNDVIAGGAGGDLIYGDDGDDVIAGGRDGGSVGGGAGNDVYLFNLGDGALFVDNTPGVLGGETDTLSFGTGVVPGNVIAYVDQYGTLTLAVQGTSDQVLINWYTNNDQTYLTRDFTLNPSQVVPRVQFIDAQGNVNVFDLAGLMDANFGALLGSTLENPVFLFGSAAGSQYDLTGSVPVAGGDYATRYATTGDMFGTTPPPGNHAPEAGVAIGSQSAIEGQPLSINLPAGAFTDADGDALTYSAALVGGAGLPMWLQFNSQTGQFTGTPDDAEVAAGTLSIQVTASDGQGGQATQSFDLSMVSVNDAPQAAAPTVSAQATEDAAFQFSLPAGFFSDADAGEVLSVSADPADMPAWLSFDATSMSFSGTPTNDDVGSFSVTVTATDSGGLRTSTEVAIAVANTNDAPTVVNELGVYVSDEDAAFSMFVPGDVFADVDAGDSLSVNLEGLPAWATYDAATGMISGTPGNGDVGSYALKLVATDAAGATAEESFSITVINVNDAPTLDNAIGDQAATEDTAFSFTLPANTFGDVDAGDVLTLSAGGMPQWLSFDPASGTFSGTPGNGDVGTVSVTVTATDAAGASVSNSFDIAVANTNDAPTLGAAINDQVADEGSAFSFTLPAGMFADVDAGDVLTLSASMADGSDLPSWLSFDAANGSFSGTPGWGDAGTLSIRVTATDGSGASVSDDFDVSVNDVNTPPVVANPISDQTAVEDALFTYTLPADVFADLQGDNLVLSATLADGSPLPAWLSFDPATGTFSGMPGNANVGALSLRVTASEAGSASAFAPAGSMSASTVFSLSVLNANDAPELVTAIADQTAMQGQPFSMTLPADAFRDIDPGDSLSYQVRLANGDPLPAWLSFDAANLTLSGTPTVSGNLDLRVIATDGSNATASDVFALNVSAVSEPPAPEPGKDLRGGSGNDTLVGGTGNDVLRGRGGRDVLLGGAGDDTLKFYRDSTWGGGTWRTHNGSPGVDGTGDRVSIAGKRRSYDIFNGGEGMDTLFGSDGSDAILLDDRSGSALMPGPRLLGVEVIDARAGNDLVDLTSQTYAYGDVTIKGGAGDDTLWSSSGNDALFGDWGNDRMHGGTGNDYLSGGSGRDTLRGDGGIDLLQGGSSGDDLWDWGRALLDGGSGDDTIGVGAGNSMIIGGRGDDSIRLGGGFDVVAFNRGDGRDVVESGNGGDATLSLGSGIRIQDLSFRRSGRDLVLETGNRESITLEDWYRGRYYQAVSTLQLITEGMSGPSALRDDAIETFDFRGLVSAFDTARSRNPGLSKWALTNGLAAFDLGGSDTEALGGDLAYQYGMTGSLAGIAVGAAQDVVGAAEFGSDTQRLRAFQVLEDGLVKLA